ncbi:MAG TPA: hypothetical protein VKZ53_17130 [Candidatus Angelobacter sp.]|nr:hypothetical protein [Candidatus Angelobacter sp.]
MAVTSEVISLDHVNKRVDEALAANRRTEAIIIMMASGIFVLGVAIILLGYWQRNPYVAGAALLFQGLLYWPIKEVLKLRRDNLILQTVPTIVSTLPPKECADEIRKMLKFLREQKP